MHQITWFWPPKLKNLPTVGGGHPPPTPSPRLVASPLGLVAPLPRICSQNILCVFLEVRNPPPHFWRPVYATAFHKIWYTYNLIILYRKWSYFSKSQRKRKNNPKDMNTKKWHVCRWTFSLSVHCTDMSFHTDKISEVPTKILKEIAVFKRGVQ